MNQPKIIIPDIDPHLRICINSRGFIKISPEDLRQLLIEHNLIVTGDNGWLNYYFHPAYYPGSIYDSPKLHQYLNDLRGFKFDFENNITHANESPYSEDILGIHTLSNGLTYLGVASGGDLEVPVFHIVYWDGERIRAYVPIYGNIVKRESKSAFNDRTEMNEVEFYRLKELYRLDVPIGNPDKIEEVEEKILDFLHDERKIKWELENVFYEIIDQNHKPSYSPYHNNLIESSQCEFLFSLELQVGKVIPLIQDIPIRQRYIEEPFAMIIDNMNIKELNLMKLGMRSLPDSISNLIFLEKLIVDNNNLKILPFSLSSLPYLEELSMESNELTYEGIEYEDEDNKDNEDKDTIGLNFSGIYPSLKKINLSHNLINSLPEIFIDRSSFPGLEELNLRNNNLEEIPTAIDKLEKLRTLLLGYNLLPEIPTSIGNFRNLNTLDLSGNRLNNLPESIGKLNSLKYLYAWDNHLGSLPESIGNLKDLRNLTLSGNNLVKLPGSITNLMNLETLDFGENPDLNFTPEQKKWIENLKNRGCNVTLNG